MNYKDESGILTLAGEKPKILSAHDEGREVYRIHWDPICRGTYFMTSKILPIYHEDLRTDDLEIAKERAKRRYRELKAA